MATTLLEALSKFDEDVVVEMLASGELSLTGNFRGHEAEVVASYKES